MAYILGIDCSHWQASVDWAFWAAKGYKFAWLKATEGTSWKDDKYLAHRAAALAQGFVVGAYHYFRGEWQGAIQAEHFFATAGPNTLPPAIDVESRNNTGIPKATFISRLLDCAIRTQSLFGRKPVIYTSISQWGLLVGSAPQIAQMCDLWTAHYTTAATPLIPSDWTPYGWKVWQFTSTPLDQNRARQEWWNSIVAPPPVPVKVSLTVPQEADIIELVRV